MRIIRFIASDGTTPFGEDHKDGSATILTGSIQEGFARTTQRVAVKKLLAPILPTDIICIGRNYRAPPHKEAGGDPQSSAAMQPEPDSTLEVFLKPSTAIQNPDDPIFMPRFDGDLDPQMDCEGELAIIIGRGTRNVSESDAQRHVFGYTIANDVTARTFQTSTGPPIWMRGKGFDGFLPIGPAIVTPDEIDDLRSLDLRTIINGEVVREGKTCQMIRSIPQIIAALSRHMTLRSGSLIITGAPVATRATQILPGHTLEIEIPPIGRLVNFIT